MKLSYFRVLVIRVTTPVMAAEFSASAQKALANEVHCN